MSSKNNLSNFCCDPKNDSLHNYAVCYRTGSTVDHDLYDWRSSHILQPFLPLAKYPLYSGATRPQITLLCSRATRPQITPLCSGATRPQITPLCSGATRPQITLLCSGATRPQITLLCSEVTRPQITLLCSEVTRPQITLLCSGSACPHITWMLSVGNRGKEIWTPEQPPILASLYVSSRIQTLNFLKALARQ